MTSQPAEKDAAMRHRCPTLIDGNPCERSARHEGECFAVTMTGRVLSPGEGL